MEVPLIDQSISQSISQSIDQSINMELSTAQIGTITLIFIGFNDASKSPKYSYRTQANYALWIYVLWYK